MPKRVTLYRMDGLTPFNNRMREARGRRRHPRELTFYGIPPRGTL